jgi:hypothetical protein
MPTQTDGQRHKAAKVCVCAGESITGGALPSAVVCVSCGAKAQLSQKQLAERCELHWTYISAVERDLRGPTLDVVGRLATGLGISPAELFATLKGTYRSRSRSRPRIGESARRRPAIPPP